MTDNTLRKSIYVKASRAQVWGYLTDPELLKTWFHAPKAPLALGEHFEMSGRDNGEKLVWGRVRDFSEDERLEYTFTISQLDGVKSKVIWTLKDAEPGTRVSLVHSGLPRGAKDFDLLLALDKGWDGHLADLRAQLIALTA
ncbi:uncharacterized protein YndB with AHSA1/START domain [Pacificibacter maritimus]|uniref:Uncharacterized protein YndB with AHSA1/START domain n=1 Tax=Pacificibacter maritimus TaxID=762213 RepID=A0A3N4UWQ7_9RHOB|nr:SRPBCC domain-containing protein [Pacificibacter maritimus]RPE71991.1 uncharacterized protein YndB with AHSA1/START domain [Pacificibacter maritimus]